MEALRCAFGMKEAFQLARDVAILAIQILTFGDIRSQAVIHHSLQIHVA